MATQACNISCQGCQSYSYLPWKGYVPWQQAKSWLEPWTKMIDFTAFGILGGEPLLNPEIKSYLYGCRELMPDSNLRLHTNGLLLKSVEDWLKILDEIGNARLEITIHGNDNKLKKTIKEILAARPWKAVRIHPNYSIWTLDNGVQFTLNKPKEFLVTYLGTTDAMMPHQSHPDKAYKLCQMPTCPMLYRGKIYKCAQSALIKDTLEKINATTKQYWDDFLDHGISPDSNYQDIVNFIDNFGKSNAICAQCPEDSSFFIQHQNSVSLRKIPIKKSFGNHTVDNVDII